MPWVPYRVPATFTLTAANTDVDLFLARPASGTPMRLKGWVIAQASEVGDAQEEAVRITVRHMAATLTVTGGTTVTAVENRPSSDLPAADGTYTVNHPTVTTTSGTSTVVEEWGWNVRNTPWERWIPEEDRPEAVNAEGLMVRLETTLADDVTFAVTFFIEELV